jgi:two-component system cell cycle sensor histidine kinase/response regulator CckA
VALLPDGVPQAALEAVANGVIVTDPRGTILWVNAAFTRMTGYSSTEAVGQNPRLLKSGEHSPDFYRELWSTITSGKSWSGDMTNRRKDGTIYVEEQTITPVPGADGKPAYFIAVKQDRTLRRRADLALRRSEERYRLLAENISDVIGLYNLAMDALYVSPSVRQLRGYTPEEVMARSMLDQLTPASRDLAERVFQEEIEIERKGGADPARSRTLEFEVVCKDGSTVWTESKVTGMRDANGFLTGFIMVSRDITERKRLEDQLRQSVKMEGIGRLAGGIAHDFNNLLTVISGRSYLLLSRLPADHPMRRDLVLIQQTGDRAAALTRQLLAFSRQQTLTPAVIDLTEILSGLKTLLPRVLGEDVEVVMDLDPVPGHVTADPGQIEQVILNMAVNSRDAMPGGGSLVLETRHVDVDAVFARQKVGLEPGRYEVLSITDTGVGMDAATVSRIFEPFFTTKPVGKGTGLGLATAYGIIKQSGGYITVDSQPGSGTTFRIYLPRTEVTGSARVGVSDVTSRRGTEVVLLVEDDPNLRALARDILASVGYTVLESQDPEDALRLAERHAGVIHLLLTDVVMPHMSGPALADLIKRSRRDVKVLYMSGYTDDAIAHHGVLDPGTAFFGKPFTPASLTQKVREVLDHPQ